MGVAVGCVVEAILDLGDEATPLLPNFIGAALKGLPPDDVTLDAVDEVVVLLRILGFSVVIEKQ